MREETQCAFCGASFQPPTKRGPATKYCKPSHRQRAYEKRRHEREIIEAKAEGGKVALRIMGE